MVTYRSRIGQALRVLLMLAGIGGSGAILTVAATEQFNRPAQTAVFGGIVLLQLLAGALFLRITRLDDEWAYAFLTGLGVGILSSIAEALGWPGSVAEALGWPGSVGGVITAGALAGVLTVVLFSGRMDPILDPVRS